MQTILLWFFLINGLYMFRTFTCPSSGVLIYRLFHCHMWNWMGVGDQCHVHCIRGWVDSRASLNGCRISRPHWDSIPRPSSYTDYAIPSHTGGWLNSPGSLAYIPLLALLEPPQRLFSAFSDTTVSTLRKNPTNALYILTPFIHTVTLLRVSALKGPSLESIDSFCEQSIKYMSNCQQHATRCSLIWSWRLEM